MYCFMQHFENITNIPLNPTLFVIDSLYNTTLNLENESLSNFQEKNEKKFNQLKSALIIASLSIIPFSSVYAILAKVDGSSVVPKILAGGTDATNGAPLLPAGAFAGVVSISINTDKEVFICTGSVISKRHIITAGHCVEDNSDTGTVIDISSANVNVGQILLMVATYTLFGCSISRHTS